MPPLATINAWRNRPSSGRIFAAGASVLAARFNRENAVPTSMYICTAQVTRLCESPFISQAFREQERSERVLELEQGGRAAQLKIDHLQVRMHCNG